MNKADVGKTRVLLHQADGDDFRCLSGGRVEPEQNAAQTVIREMQVEVRAFIQTEKTLCIVDNFFSHNGCASFCVKSQSGSVQLPKQQAHN